MINEFFPSELENCICGKQHLFPLKKIFSGKGVVDSLPKILGEFSVKNLS